MEDPQPPSLDSTELRPILEKLKLGQYHDRLVENGFDNWGNVCCISERDFEEMDFRLGHRRILQREIRTALGQQNSAISCSNFDTSPQASGAEASPADLADGLKRKRTPHQGKSKRRYRRHPKPDPNAPKKPKTAYVNFSDHMRTDPEISKLSFVEIARAVGAAWQRLPPEEKSWWHERTREAQRQYEEELLEYMKHDNYIRYQCYLNDFRRKHNQVPATDSVGRQRKDKNSSFSSFDGSGQATGPETVESSDAHYVSDSVPSSGQSECAYIVNYAVGELFRFIEAEQTELDVYDAQNLPPQRMVRDGVAAFLTGTETLFFAYRKVDALDLLDQVYTAEGPPNRLALVDVLTMAAVGSFSNAAAVPKNARESFFYSCARMLKGIRGADDLRYMRLLSTLAVYLIMESSTTARSLVSGAIQIGRLGLPLLQDPAKDSEEDGYWRRVFRTLIFLESWLCYSLRHRSMINPSDLAYAGLLTVSGPKQDSKDWKDSMDEGIQYQATSVAWLAADISERASSPNGRQVEVIRYHMQKLSAWHSALPLTMQLAMLNSERSETLCPRQKACLILVHLLYLGAVTLLHRPVLAALAELRQGLIWSIDSPPEEKLLESIQILIYQSFDSCNVLLFSAAQKLLHRCYDGLDDNLAQIESCIDVLLWCSNPSCIAGQYVHLVRPLYERLRGLYVMAMAIESSRTNGGLPHLQQTLLPSSHISAFSTELLAVVEQTTRLLMNPHDAVHRKT